jgi:hypothetical protein
LRHTVATDGPSAVATDGPSAVATVAAVVPSTLSATTTGNENAIPQRVAAFANIRPTAATAGVTGVSSPGGAAAVKAAAPKRRTTNEHIQRFTGTHGDHGINAPTQPAPVVAVF